MIISRGLDWNNRDHLATNCHLINVNAHKKVHRKTKKDIHIVKTIAYNASLTRGEILNSILWNDINWSHIDWQSITRIRIKVNSFITHFYMIKSQPIELEMIQDKHYAHFKKILGSQWYWETIFLTLKNVAGACLSLTVPRTLYPLPLGSTVHSPYSYCMPNPNPEPGNPNGCWPEMQNGIIWRMSKSCIRSWKMHQFHHFDIYSGWD